MAAQNNNAAAQTEQTGLLGKIMHILKLDEAGKIDTFLSKEKKICQNAIKGLGQEKSSLEFNFNNKKDDLNDKIEDAKEAVNAAYTSVTLKDVESNEKMAEFRDKFWSNVNRRTNALRALEEELKDLTKVFDEACKENTEQVEKQKARIARLS